MTAIDADNENATDVTRADGNTESSPEHALGDVSSQSGAGVLPASFTYDSETGQIASRTTYGSDTLGDISDGSYTANWSYDSNTGLVNYDGGLSLSYTYSPSGELLGAESNMGYDQVSGYQYNNAGETTDNAAYLWGSYPSGTVLSNTIGTDELGRPEAVTETRTTE